jgi:prevent-host-death family protein
MKTISACEFRARCLAVIENVHVTRAPVLITKRGKPVALLMPAGKPRKFIGRLEGIFKIVGDIESPIVPLDDWDSLK